MNDIISDLLRKWFEWKLKPLQEELFQEELLKQNIEKQKLIKLTIEDNIEKVIGDILASIDIELNSSLEIIKYDIEDIIEETIQEKNIDNEDKVWCNND